MRNFFPCLDFHASAMYRVCLLFAFAMMLSENFFFISFFTSLHRIPQRVNLYIVSEPMYLHTSRSGSHRITNVNVNVLHIVFFTCRFILRSSINYKTFSNTTGPSGFICLVSLFLPSFYAFYQVARSLLSSSWSSSCSNAPQFLRGSYSKLFTFAVAHLTFRIEPKEQT